MSRRLKKQVLHDNLDFSIGILLVFLWVFGFEKDIPKLIATIVILFCVFNITRRLKDK